MIDYTDWLYTRVTQRLLTGLGPHPRQDHTEVAAQMVAPEKFSLKLTRLVDAAAVCGVIRARFTDQRASVLTENMEHAVPCD